MMQAAELRDVQQQLEAVKERASTVADKLSREELWLPPVPESWSIGQCLGHLNVVGRLYLEEAMEPATTRAWEEGKTGTGPFRYSLMFRLFLWYEEPPVKKFLPIKMSLDAPKMFEPPAEPSETVLEDFMTLQDELSALTQKADGLDLVAVKMSSPAAKSFRMSLLEAFGGTLAHERRHLWQAENVKKSILSRFNRG